MDSRQQTEAYSSNLSRPFPQNPNGTTFNYQSDARLLFMNISKYESTFHSIGPQTRSTRVCVWLILMR